MVTFTATATDENGAGGLLSGYYSSTSLRRLKDRPSTTL
jgi:hypothetical protein